MHSRPPAIELPDHAPNSPQRFFARGTGRDFTAASVGDTVEIALYDSIGSGGVDAKSFRTELQQAKGKSVVLKLNSPGGSVTDGIAIYNDLIAHEGSIRVEITGVAASIASLIAMAGDEIAIAPNAFLMIHRAWGATLGNTADHVESAKLLARIDDSMATTYAARTGHDVPTIKKLLAAETWFTGREAVDAGFADEVLDGATNARARFDLSVYAKAPAELRTEFAPKNPNEISNRREFESFLRDAGMSRSRSKAVAAGWRSISQRDADESELELAAHIAAQSQSIRSIFEGQNFVT